MEDFSGTGEYRFNETAEAYDSLVRGHPLPYGRTPQAEPEGRVQLPEGTIVVSADNHWSVTDDIFYENFPNHLKDKAPRIVKTEDGEYNWMMNGKSMMPPAAARLVATFEKVPGCVSIEPRMRDLDVEGVQKEINFGNGINLFHHTPDLEVRDWVFRIYNQHLREMNLRAPGRFYGVGQVNVGNLEKIRDAVFEAKDLGLKTIQLPINPKGPDGKPMNYCMPEVDALWSAIEDADIPICFHVGESHADGPGGEGVTVMTQFAGFRKNLAELIFGGILDRFPKLQVAFVEAEINWVPGALQTASMLYECYQQALNPKLKHHPRYYWENNCYAVFMHDPAGMRLLDIVGADRVMWSQDYPHAEGGFGWCWDSIKAVLDVTTPDEARMILGGTAMKVFKLD
jgi:predicted TIM-barrel fold metal-dependent hydrolase